MIFLPRSRAFWSSIHEITEPRRTAPCLFGSTCGAPSWTRGLACPAGGSAAATRESWGGEGRALAVDDFARQGLPGPAAAVQGRAGEAPKQVAFPKCPNSPSSLTGNLLPCIIGAPHFLRFSGPSRTFRKSRFSPSDIKTWKVLTATVTGDPAPLCRQDSPCLPGLPERLHGSRPTTFQPSPSVWREEPWG